MPTETPEVIEQQIAATQEVLASKIGELEDRTVGSVRETIHSVTDALGAVTGSIGSVTDTVEKIGGMANVETVSKLIQDTVRALPVSSTVRKQPWASVGGAVLAGFITGVFVFRGSRTPHPVGRAAGLLPPQSPPSPLSGVLDTLFEKVGSEVQKTTEKVIASVGEKVSEHLSGLVSPPVARPTPAGANGTTSGATYPSAAVI